MQMRSESFPWVTEFDGVKFLVTTGLDPVVHAEIKPAAFERSPFSMDARVKPGHDEKENFR
jgi:hypothetical protein